jgi:predicted transcriptional regulator
MDRIWANGPQSADQIRKAVMPARQLSDSTIRTVLRRLEAKGLIVRESTGSRYVYRGVKARAAVAMTALQALVDKFYSGSMRSLVVGMVEEKVIEPEELQAITKQVEDAEKRRTRS